MTKPEFVKLIADKLGVKTAYAVEVLDVIGEITLDAIASNDVVPFEFGKIGGKTTNERVAYNFHTKEEIKVPQKDGRPYAKFNKKAKA